MLLSLAVATSSSCVCAWQPSVVSRGSYHKQVAKFEFKEDKWCVWPKSPCKGQNWENAWTDPCVNTLQLSGVQMLFKNVTETVSPKVLRTVQNLGGSNLVCLCFKRKTLLQKLQTKRKYGPPTGKKSVFLICLPFPSLVWTVRKKNRRVNPVQTEFRFTFHGLHHHSRYL